MPCTFDEHEFVTRGDCRHPFAHFIGSSEGIFCAVYENGGSAQGGEMIGSELGWFVRHVKRIGQEQQSVAGFRILRSQHAGLASAIGVAAENDWAVYQCSQVRCRFKQTGAVFLRGGLYRRSEGFALTKCEIAAQHEEAIRRKGFRNRDQ